jgi:hypothetical protein
MSISWADQCTAGGECAVPEPLTGHCPNMRSQRTVVIDVEHPLQSSSRAAVRPSRRDRSAAQALDDDWHHRRHHRKAPPPPGRGPIRPSDPTTRKPGPVSLQEPRSQSRWHLHAGQSLPSTTEPTHEVRLISTYSGATLCVRRHATCDLRFLPGSVRCTTRLRGVARPEALGASAR